VAEIPPALLHSIQVIEGKLQQVISSIQNQSPGGNPAAIDARLEAYGANLDKLDRIVALLESSSGLPNKDPPQPSPPQPSQVQLSERMDRLLSTLESTGALQHRIEELSSQMKKQTDLEAKQEEQAKELEKVLPRGLYVDSSNPPQGQELIICDEKKLSIQETARLEFGRQLTSLVGISEAIKLRAAKSLPPSNGYENNAFRNSYFYDDKAQVLYIHTNRLSSSGDFGLVAIHALSHIKVPFLFSPLPLTTPARRSTPMTSPTIPILRLFRSSTQISRFCPKICTRSPPMAPRLQRLQQFNSSPPRESQHPLHLIAEFRSSAPARKGLHFLTVLRLRCRLLITSRRTI
jgi:hypothetical protein